VEPSEWFELSTNRLPTVLCQRTFCPLEKLQMELAIRLPAQIDTRGWTLAAVEDAEAKLVEEIMADLRVKVKELVDNVKPYHCYYFPSDHKK
jgi:hypothetical protein